RPVLCHLVLLQDLIRLLAGTDEMLFYHRVTLLQETQGKLSANTKPGFGFVLQQVPQSIGDYSAQARRHHRFDRVTAVHARVLQDHVPEEALRSAAKMIWDPRMVELIRCLPDVFKPRLVNIGPFVAYRYPLVDGI